ncbi:radical SAM protein [Candidatus Azambacteria bacterium]|nr:radical SAM protein [Candidatus Azambacteria bacterium]
MYKTLDAPLAAHVEINTGCNQKCFHCYNFWRDDGLVPNKSISEALSIRIAEQLAAHKIFHVILTGGEPLLNKGELIFLIKELSKRKISFSLNSNLVLLTEKIAKELFSVGLRTILTSLLSYDSNTHDSLSGTKGSFQRIVRGIECAHAAGIRTAVNMVVMEQNLLDVKKTGEFAHKLGVVAFSATRVTSPRLPNKQSSKELALPIKSVGLIVDQLLDLKTTGMQLDSLVPYPICFFDNDDAYSLLGQRTCSAGKTSIAIASDGSVRACPHHEIAYGSLSTEDLKSIWLKMVQWRDGSLLPRACLSCKLVAMCGGGCRVASLNGDVHGEDSIMRAQMAQKRAVPKTHALLKNNTVLRVRRACRFRRDEPLGIINTSGIKNTFVEHETLNLIEDIHIKKLSFTPKSLRAMYKISMENAKYLHFLSELISRNVLELVV